MTPTTTVTLYIARNHLGEYSAGYNWYPDLKRGRFYIKRGPVSASVTRWVQRNPRDPVPEILTWVIDPVQAKVFGTPEDAKKRVGKIRARKAKCAEETRLRDLEYVGEEEKRLAEKRARLEGRA
jgi:hypothetical protein